MAAAVDSHRSLFPLGEAAQPFTWNATDIEPSLVELTARIQRMREHPLPAPTLESLRQWFRTQHVYHSNAIEGSTLTLAETQVVIGDGLTVGGRPLRDVLAAKNLAEALDWVEQLKNQREALNQRLIRQLHALIMQGESDKLPGHYKTEDNLVTGANFRPPSHLQTASLMEALERYLSEPSGHHPIVVSAVTHAWIAGIHPFRDGNGRTARLLANLVLLRWQQPIALLTQERRPEYYESLDKAHCTGDATDFILLWFSCVERVLAEYERLSGDLAIRERDVDYIAERIRHSNAGREAILRRWQDAVLTLSAELADVARKLNERVGLEGAQVKVTLNPVTVGSLEQARNGSVPLLRLQGNLPHGPFAADVVLSRFSHRDAPGGVWLELPWTGAGTDETLVGLRLGVPGWTLEWIDSAGKRREEPSVSPTAAATILWRQAMERAAGLLPADVAAK